MDQDQKNKTSMTFGKLATMALGFGIGVADAVAVFVSAPGLSSSGAFAAVEEKSSDPKCAVPASVAGVLASSVLISAFLLAAADSSAAFSPEQEILGSDTVSMSMAPADSTASVKNVSSLKFG